MFGIAEAVVFELKRVVAEDEAFKRMCDALPKDQADALRAKRNSKHEADLKHRQALEIANASRARNFWGYMMTNEMKLLTALCDALGFDVESVCVNQDEMVNYAMATFFDVEPIYQYKLIKRGEV